MSVTVWLAWVEAGDKKEFEWSIEITGPEDLEVLVELVIIDETELELVVEDAVSDEVLTPVVVMRVPKAAPALIA